MGVYFGSHKLEKDLGRQSLRGGAILIVARGVNAVVQIGSVLFLARLLTPEDYGLVAMVAALTAFGPALVDLGTRDAVAQRPTLTEGEASTLFWITAGVGCACALAISAAAPLIARFYNEPRLVPIAIASSLTFVLLGLTAQHQGLLRRGLMFRELAIIDIAANVLSACGAVTLAYCGFGYWALVTRSLTLCLLTLLATWLFCRWLPGAPSMTSGVRDMIKLGLNQSGFVATDFIARSSDRVTVGRGLGARVLGLYQNAIFIYDQVIDILVHPLHQVAVSSLSKLQHDRVELRRAWAKALSSLAFVAMPAFGILAVSSSDLIVFVLGDKWVQSGALLSVLALRGMAQSVERTLGWLHVAAARTDRWLRWGIVATCFQLGALLCGLPFGPFGVVWAHVLATYVLFVPAIAFSGWPVGIGARDVIATVGPQLISALAATGLGFALRASVLVGVDPITRMAVLVVVCLAAYLAMVVAVFRVTAPLQVTLSLGAEFLPRPLKALVARLPLMRS
jgi:PST family polysaccharide transporter